MQTQKRESKIENQTRFHNFTTLSEEAFKRPVEVKDIEENRADFLVKLYGQQPEYDKNTLYHEQIQKLANLLEKIAREYKEISAENLSKITAFPNYLKELIIANPDTIPYHNIKQTFEKIIYLLQKKININAEDICKRFQEQKIELSTEELKVQLDVEKKDADYAELRKENVLINLLPYLLVCDTGIAGHLDFALEYLTGGDSLEDVWCQLRTKYVTDFGYEHVRKNKVREGAEIHVPVVLRNHALKQNWGIRSELKNVEDHFYKETLITPQVLKYFEVGFHNAYQLRSMTDSAAQKFEELFFRDYFRKYKGNDFLSHENHNKWIKIHDNKIFSCAEDILKKWNINNVSGTQVFEKKGEDNLRFSLHHFKQFFWQYCRNTGRYVKNDSWTEEKIFENYRLIHSNLPSQTEMAWIEDNQGEIVSFNDLSSEEKMRYFIYSTVQFGIPDRYQWLGFSPAFFEIFKSKNDFVKLARAMDENHQWAKHKALFIKILHEQPKHFITLLTAIEDNAIQTQLLDLVGIHFHWLHPKDKFYQAMHELISVDEKLSLWLNQELHQIQKQFVKFQDEYKLDKNITPIPYSSLLQIAPRAKPDDQFIFKMYLQEYFPHEYHRVTAEDKPDYAHAFLIAHQNDIKGLSQVGKQIRLSIQDGNLKALQDLKASLIDVYAHINWMHLCQHQHLLNYYYRQEMIACMEQRSHFQAPLLYWVVAFNQSRNENKEIDTLLETKELNINKPCEDGETPLHVAVNYGLKNWVKILLSYYSCHINICKNGNITPLMLAAMKGQLDILRILLEHGALVTLASNTGATALHFAVQSRQLDIIRLLLDKGAQINAMTNDGVTPLYLAAQDGDLNMVYFLLENGAHLDLPSINGLTPLYVAAYHGHVEIVRLLLSRGAQVNAKTNHGNSSLSIAAQYGHLSIVQILIANGADINAARKDGMTSLYLAAASGHQEVARLLLEKGANVNARLNDGTSSLYIATQNSNLNMVRILLNAGADPTLSANGKTLYEIAENCSIKQLLSAAEAKFKNRTSLHESRIFEKYRLVRANSPEFPGAWIEDQKGEIIFFENLPAAEKMKYFIYSTVQFGFPDRFQWVKPSPNLLDVFKEEKDFVMLAKALEADQQWHKHKLLLTTILYERPNHFLELLAAINDLKTQLDILGLLKINFHWLHPHDELNKTMIHLPMLAADEKFGLWLAMQINQQRMKLDTFKLRHQIDLNQSPVPYSSLLKIAEHPKPDDQPILKLYLQRYFPKASREVQAEEKPNYCSAFLNAHKNNMNSLRQLDKIIRLHIQNGNLTALQEMKVSIQQIYTHIYWMHLCQHQHLKDYFYRQAAIACEEKRSPYKAPLLFWMVAFNQQEKENKEVEALLSIKDLNVNECSNGDWTALHMATYLGLTSWVKILLDKGALVDQPLSGGITALHLAAQEDDINIVRLLVEKGADLNVINSNNSTPLHFAVQNGHVQIVRYLIAKGAQLNSNKWNVTPLYRAAQNGYLEIVRILLEAGANPTLSPSPYQVATNPQIKKLLLIAELKLEMKKFIATESKEPGVTFFSSHHFELLQAIQLLQSFLEENVSKSDFEKLSLKKILNKAPWDNFYNEALKISAMVEKAQLRYFSYRR